MHLERVYYISLPSNVSRIDFLTSIFYLYPPANIAVGRRIMTNHQDRGMARVQRSDPSVGHDSGPGERRAASTIKHSPTILHKVTLA